MSPSRHGLLDEALAISRRMAELGGLGEWEAVVALEPQRRQLLEQAFATHAPPDEFVTDRVRAILDLDKRLMAQSLEAREQVAREIAQHGRGRRATQAYHSAQR
jgi:hypothetical protein